MRWWALAMSGALAACSPSNPESVAVASGEAAAHEDAWSTTRLADGVVVRLRPEPLPIREGRTTFHIELDPDPVGDAKVSIDVLSPSMPAHGITRYEARREESGVFVVDAEIPMAGAWTVYVNLDSGETAAPFSFEVLGADTASMHGAHMRTGSSPADSVATDDAAPTR